MEPSTLAQITLEAQQSFPLFLAQASAEALLIWDIIITFDGEIELIWKAPKSMVKYVYLFIRYSTLSIIIFDTVVSFGMIKSKINICLVLARYEVVMSSLLLWSVDLLLLPRVYAFYGKNRKLLYSLLALLALNIGAISVLAILICLRYPIIHVTTNLIPGILTECVVTTFPRFNIEIWICELIFHSTLFLLVMFRFIREQIETWHENRGISGIYLVFIRDGVWAYIVLFVLFFGSAVEHRLSGTPWIVWTISFIEITTTRLILNLRNAVSLTDEEDSETWMEPIVFDTIEEPVYEDTGDIIELNGFGRE